MLNHVSLSSAHTGWTASFSKHIQKGIIAKTFKSLSERNGKNQHNSDEGGYQRHKVKYAKQNWVGVVKKKEKEKKDAGVLKRWVLGIIMMMMHLAT